MSAARLRPTYLAIDFGTSRVKAAVGHSIGRPLAVASRPVDYYRPQGGPETASEFDPEAAWQSTLRAAREALRASKVHPSRIAAVGVTSQRLGLVLLGKSHDVLYAGPNRDARAVFEGAEIDAAHGAALWRATGHGPGLLLAWSKLVWFQRNRPDIFDKSRYVSSIADWLVHHLTGVLALESALATGCGLAMVATGLPAGVFKAPLGLGSITLPPVCQAGRALATLKSGAASALGLTPGIPVVPCGPDTQTGLVGLGSGQPGAAGAIAGWSAATQLVTPAPLFDDTRSLWTGRHVVPGRYILEANSGDMGGAYSWLLGLLAPGQKPEKAHAWADRVAAGVEPGGRGAAAYLGPTFVNMHSVGLRPGGIIFPVPLSFEPPDAASLLRAATENFAYALRYSLDRLALASGMRISEAAIGGGMARSRTFRHVVSAAAGMPVRLNSAGDATLRGALSITAVGAGEAEWETVLAKRGTELDTLDTGPALASQYADLYDAWRLRERRLNDFEL